MTSLFLNFLTCEIGMIIVHTRRVAARAGGENSCEVLTRVPGAGALRFWSLLLLGKAIGLCLQSWLERPSGGA